MTDKSTIQSWSRPQLESAFTQREEQLEVALAKIEELKQLLAATDTTQRDTP